MSLLSQQDVRSRDPGARAPGQTPAEVFAESSSPGPERVGLNLSHLPHSRRT